MRRAGLLGVCLALGCSSPAPDRPQLVVYVDTDAAVIGQAADDPSFAWAALVDTLRITVLDDSLAAVEERDLVVPDPASWPVSFGLTPRDDGGPTLIRLRLFRGALAGGDGDAPEATLRSVAIDRLVSLSSAEVGVTRVRVVMSLECLGRPSSFVEPLATCVDEERPAAAVHSGVQVIESSDPKSSAGTSPLAREWGCKGPPPAPPVDAVCVPGGLSFLGDPYSLTTASFDIQASTPVRAVYVSPFWLDRTELTVGGYRALGGHPLLVDAPPVTQGPACTWLGDDMANDALPLTCVNWGAAAPICAARGGFLPTEAQWEHAARGRAGGTVHPWGNEAPSCCAVSGSRNPALPGACEPTGIEPPGSHADPAACGGIADVSRDGVLDLAGSVAELTADNISQYDAPCWGGPGILYDPICLLESEAGHTLRGGSWFESFYFSTTFLRRVWLDLPNFQGAGHQGMRCAYADAP